MKTDMQKFKLHSSVLAAILLLAVVLPSCQFNGKPDTAEIQENIVYFKDTNTGLCFAAVNSTKKMVKYIGKLGTEAVGLTIITRLDFGRLS